MSPVPLEWSQEQESIRGHQHFEIAGSPAMQEVFWQMTTVRKNSNLLLLGSPGSGKTEAARVVSDLLQPHADARKHVYVNAAAFANSLLESELFGHAGKAFTGASQTPHIGKFEEANGGTIMLDEIGQIPRHVMRRLLSVMDCPRLYSRVGENETRELNLVAICGTAEDLPRRVQKGKFHQPLYDRISQKVIRLPSLKERGPEYLDHLVPTLLRKIAADKKKKTLQIDQAVLDSFKEMPFPGNLRELSFLLSEMCAIAYERAGTADAKLTHEHLEIAFIANGRRPENADAKPSSAEGVHYTGTFDEIEKSVILERLQRFGGHQLRTAKSLGIGARTLFSKLRNWGITSRRSPDQFEEENGKGESADSRVA